MYVGVKKNVFFGVNFFKDRGSFEYRIPIKETIVMVMEQNNGIATSVWRLENEASCPSIYLKVEPDDVTSIS
ncbi:MAG: hypothetical protein J6F30_02555 [Cellulosilyticum sp.]|nr:hypothetical protein [Cellulosilyticum sp.]